MPRPSRRPPFELTTPVPGTATLPQLPLDPGVRLVIEGADPVAVEAAVAELRARLGGRFAVTDRRVTGQGVALRVTGSLRIDPAHALDAGGG
jgi:hypothetical protein